jgi:hypothetical protein
VITGPVPGAPGLVVAAKPDATYCGGTAVSVVVKSAAGLDPELVAALTIEAPHDPDSLRAFVTASTAKVQAARELYVKRAKTDRAASLARIAQVMRRFAEVMIRFPIPQNVRTGVDAADNTAAFCEQLESVAEPLLTKAEEAAALCRDAGKAAGAGWWNAACAK